MSMEPQDKPRRRFRVLLIGSLALNLLIIGLVVGAVVSLRSEGRPTPIADRFGAPHIKALSQEDKRAVGRAIRSAYRKAEVEYRAPHQAYKQVIVLLRSEPLDEAAVRALVTQLDKAGETRRELAREVFLTRLQAMDAAERAAYADRLQEVLEHAGKGHKGKKDHHRHKPEE